MLYKFGLDQPPTKLHAVTCPPERSLHCSFFLSHYITEYSLLCFANPGETRPEI
jgi:hypothetical protein